MRLGGGEMDDVRFEYSQLRGTWNVFVNGEWYYEGTYEDALEVANSFYDDNDEYYGDDGDANYRPEEEYEYD